MRDYYNYLWRHKLRVWLIVFGFSFVSSILVRSVFGRPDWVFIVASAVGWPSGLLFVASLKRDK